MALRRGLIVNADDFGLHESINEAVEHAHRAGILTSASLVVNGDAFEQAVAIAKRNPALSVGIHLTLNGERPVAPSGEVASLLDANSQRLHERHFKVCWEVWWGAIPIEQVVRECRAQLRRFLASGLRPTHVDSHRHLHMFPPIFRALAPLLAEYRMWTIRWVRIPWFDYTSLNLPKALAVLLWEGLSGRLDRRFRHPDYFVGFGKSGCIDAEYLRQILFHLPPGVTELSLHPGTDDAVLGRRYAVWRTVHHWACQWEQEYQALLQPALKPLITTQGITLMSYTDL